MLRLLALVLITCNSLVAAIIPWPSFQVGQKVEIDSACTGNWKRATILTSGRDPYSRIATRYSAKFDDGHEWTFSGPGIVAPCIRALSASAAAPVKALNGFFGPRLQGLYLQLQPAGAAYAYVHYYFWPDGRLCEGLPSGGLDREPVDFAVVQKQKKCGQYRINGKRMSVQWQGDTSPHELSLVNFRTGSFEMNGYATSKVPPFASGQRLNGTYSATVVGRQMRKQAYAFHSDGTYQMMDQPVTSRDGAAKHEQGTYRLANNTLELSGNHRLTAYAFPNGGISLEGTVFNKN